MFNRIKRISSHVGVHRFIHDLPIAGWIVRQKDIRTPYSSGPTHLVYLTPLTGFVIVAETAHKRYDVFAVPADVTIYPTDEAATEAFLASLTPVKAFAIER